MDSEAPKSMIGTTGDEQGNWHQHRNPDGSAGGLVENTAFVAATAYVAPGAVVQGNARIEDTSEVKGTGQVIDAVLADHAIVEGQGVAIGGEFRGETVRDEVRIRGGSLTGGWASRTHPRINNRAGVRTR